MRLYEYEGKSLFKRFKIPVPDGTVIRAGDLSDLAKATYPCVIKAQVFTGGRGRAGAVQFASNSEEAEMKINEMFGKMHGPYVIDKVLVERKLDIAQEFYIAATIDRLLHKPLFIACSRGGVEIELTAQSAPEAIKKSYFEAGAAMPDFFSRKIAESIGFSGETLNQAAMVILNSYKMFCGLDCKLVEINPLVITHDKKLFAVDAKVDLDEDAMYRHPELKEMGIVARHEVGELTERERLAKAAGIPYVDLDGDIGVFPGGAGFGIAAIDLITHYGGRPANFMDSGGAPTQEKLRSMLGLLIDNPRVKAIFGARFGGISRCDDWAKAVVQYILENRPKKPMIMRMAGNMEVEGRKVLEKAKKQHPQLFRKIKIYAYDTPIEEVIKETIKTAKSKGRRA